MALDEQWADEEFHPVGVDDGGSLVERTRVRGFDVVIHHAEVPDSDVTVVGGVPCTTPLRTIIDCAPELSMAELLDMFDQFIRRRLFTVEEAWNRIGQPDMHGRRGAELLRRLLPPIAG